MTTVRYTSAANVLPESKMRLYPTKVINIIGGPGSDKSLISAAIILYLHLHNKTVETIPDYAKSLVWQQNFEVLKNQYFIAQRQFEMLSLLDGKTRTRILDWYQQYDNVNIFVERGDKKYVHTGRFQDEDQARAIDRGLRELMEREGLPYTALQPNVQEINAFVASMLA